MRDARTADSSFELVLFVVTKRRITCPGPPGGISEESIAVSWLDVEKWFAAIVGTGSVIGDKEDKGVIELLVLFKIFDEASDFLINTINHGCEGNHAVDFILLLPRNNLPPLSNVKGAWTRAEILGKNA